MLKTALRKQGGFCVLGTKLLKQTDGSCYTAGCGRCQQNIQIRPFAFQREKDLLRLDPDAVVTEKFFVIKRKSFLRRRTDLAPIFMDPIVCPVQGDFQPDLPSLPRRKMLFYRYCQRAGRHKDGAEKFFCVQMGYADWAGEGQQRFGDFRGFHAVRPLHVQ